jgi:hypothetical protein
MDMPSVYMVASTICPAEHFLEQSTEWEEVCDQFQRISCGKDDHRRCFKACRECRSQGKE